MKIKKFLDLKAPVFINKSNGQLSISISRRKLKEMIKSKGVPKNISLRIFKW